MNSYIFLHRMTGPAILLLLGIVALLHQAHLVHWGIFVPLLLILIGIIKLAQRVALAGQPYPPAQYPGQANPAASQPVNAIVPQPSHDFDRNANGGQS